MIALLLSAALAAEGPVPDEEIVVEADSGVAEGSASVTVIAVDEDLPASADVASAIGGAPGTSVRRLGGLGDYASVSIRGSAARQVEVYLDGIPLNPEGSETVNLAELPLRAFERIEVYRGNAPPELGGSAIGGVVNLVSRDRVGSEAAIGGGSWATVQGHAATQQELGRSDLLVVADGMRTAGRFPYLDDRGTAATADDRLRERGNNDRQQGTLHLRLRSGEWTLLSAGLLRESGVPGFTWAPAREVRLRTARELLVLGWDRRAGAVVSGVSAWGSARDEVLDDPAGEVGFAPGSVGILTAGGGARGHVRWTPDPVLAAVGALEVRGTGLRSDQRWFTGRTASDATLGAVVRDRSERVALSPVLQGTVIRDAVQGPAEPVTTAFLAPRAGALVALGEHAALTANGGLYLRPADLQERFGNQGALVGNPDLLPERGTQVDAGVRLARGEVRGELIGFAGWARDRIVWLQNARGAARPENVDEVRTAGVEAASAGEAGPVDWSASLTFTRAVQGELVAPLPGLPAWEWHHRLGLGSDFLRVSGLLDATTPTPLDSAGILRTAPRWILGASVRAVRGPVSIELDGMNLTNRIIEEVPRDPLVPDGTRTDRAVTDFLGYPLPGRTFLLTVGIAG